MRHGFPISMAKVRLRVALLSLSEDKPAPLGAKLNSEFHSETLTWHMYDSTLPRKVVVIQLTVLPELSTDESLREICAQEVTGLH